MTPLGAQLRAVIAAARQVHPRVGVGDDEVARWLAQRATGDTLPHLAGDVLVACGCAHGDSGALAVMEDTYLPRAVKALQRLKLTPTQLDEVKQKLRVRLFVGADGAPPKIETYMGRASLDSWLRVAAVNLAINHIKRRDEVALDENEELLPATAGDPELEYMREEYREHFKTSMREALATLDPQRRNVLRQHYFDGLSIDELGALHGVHRATAARWLEQARAEVFKETRRQLSRALEMTRPQFESFMRQVRSRFDISLQSLFTVP